MPIKKGDYCIVLFCDRNFSIWWDSGAETGPESERKHSLSDGIAIVGLNPRSSPLGYDGNGVKWFFADDISLESTGKIHIGNSAQDILKIFNGLIDVIKGLSTYGSPTAQVLDAASQQALESYKNTVGQLFKEAE
jgi:hypothetical protein